MARMRRSDQVSRRCVLAGLALLVLALPAVAREPVALSGWAPLGIKWKDRGPGEYAGFILGARYGRWGVEASQLWTRWLPIPGYTNSTDEAALLATAALPLDSRGRFEAEASLGPAWFRNQRDDYGFGEPGYAAGAAVTGVFAGFGLRLLARYSRGPYTDCCPSLPEGPQEKTTQGVLVGAALGFRISL